MIHWPVPYQNVERALALMYGADDATQCGALRARLDNARRLNVLGLGKGPGKGSALAYTADLAHRLGLALELQSFGLQPQTVADLFAAQWSPRRKVPTISSLIDRALGGDDIVITLQTDFISGRWRDDGDALPVIGYVDGAGAWKSLHSWLAADKPGGVSGSRPRVCVFNLSSWLRDFRRALDAVVETK